MGRRPSRAAPAAIRSSSAAVSDGVGEQVDSHPQRGLVLGGRIVMHRLVLPAITEIALIGVIDHQPAVHEDAESLRRLAVMLVNLGNACRKLVNEVIDRVVKRYLDEGTVGKQPLDLAAKRFIESVIVVGVEEAALQQPPTQDGEL